MRPVNEQIEIIKRGTVEIIQTGELRKKLEKNKQLIVKAGFDPTAPDIHLGHTVLLRKLRQFQDLGHRVIFLIGDFTATIGDPSGQSQTRKTPTFEEVEKNVKTYLKQVGKILHTDNKELFEVRYNSHWFGKGPGGVTMSLIDFLQNITAKYTVARLIERDDFATRLKKNKPITVLELLYPLMQGYDSVVLNADIELGGTDQKFNLLVGRNIQSSFNLEPQVVITMPLLEGTDGVDKMSKSLGNYIGIDEAPKEIFGKVMSVSDELMMRYYELLTDEPLDRLKSGLNSGELHPRDAKKKLAKLIITQYCGAEAAETAEENFEKAFKDKKFPDNIPLTEAKYDTPDFATLLSEITKASKSEIGRKLKEGAVEINGERIKDRFSFTFKKGVEYKIRIGKRFYRVMIGNS